MATVVGKGYKPYKPNKPEVLNPTIQSTAPVYQNTVPSYNTSQGTAVVSQPTYSAQKYTHPTELTARYKDKMIATEGLRPSPYVSAYEDKIRDILDTISNKKPFDINKDANYQQLYNNYKERYTVQADKAMRDTMASANVATGGYGSTYGQMVGQQAYDNTMQGLNDQNINLMNLAYGMYADDRNNDYKMLSAYQGQDAVEYGRHRDDVSDWMNDRNYYSNRYDNSFQTDYQAYSDALNTAIGLAQNGLPIPPYLSEAIDKYNNSIGLSGGAADSLSGLASQALALEAQRASRSGRGSGGKNKKTPKGYEDYASNLVGNGAYAMETRDAVNYIGSQLSNKSSKQKVDYLKSISDKIDPELLTEIATHEGVLTSLNAALITPDNFATSKEGVQAQLLGFERNKRLNEKAKENRNRYATERGNAYLARQEAIKKLRGGR